MADTTINIREFRRNLPTYLRQVRHGASLVVTSRGQEVARVTPVVVPVAGRRPIGVLKGKIWMAPDWEELPADIVAAMEGAEDDPALW